METDGQIRVRRRPTKRRRRSRGFVKAVADYLASDCYMYAPILDVPSPDLPPSSAACSPPTTGFIFFLFPSVIRAQNLIFMLVRLQSYIALNVRKGCFLVLLYPLWWDQVCRFHVVVGMCFGTFGYSKSFEKKAIEWIPSRQCHNNYLQHFKRN